MQAIFISTTAVTVPQFFTRYHHKDGFNYQRLESTLDDSSFQRDKDAVRIELYQNSSGGKVKPVLLHAIVREG